MVRVELMVDMTKKSMTVVDATRLRELIKNVLLFPVPRKIEQQPKGGASVYV
jgi:hypothetical protein